MICLSADTVIAADAVHSPGWVRIDGERIVAVGAGDVSADTALAGTLAPGFIDMHVHGGGGAYFSAGPQAARAVLATHRAHGTTTLLASLVTAPHARLLDQVRMLAGSVRDGTLAGIHIEGIFLSEARRGAHDPALLRDPAPDLLEPLLEAGDGTIRMVTLAPERAHALAAVRRLVDAGIVVAVGHTDATASVCAAAFDAGASVATHLYNAMRPVHLDRDGGPVVAALLDERVTLELIADGVHVARESLELAWRLGRGRLALITDAIAAAGAGDGDYLLGELAVQVRGGVARLADGGSLAGSTLTMDAAFARLVREHGASPAQASWAASGRPAQALGLTDRGTIAAGLRADLVALDRNLAVERVMCGGRWVK